MILIDELNLAEDAVLERLNRSTHCTLHLKFKLHIIIQAELLDYPTIVSFISCLLKVSFNWSAEKIQIILSGFVRRAIKNEAGCEKSGVSVQ